MEGLNTPEVSIAIGSNLYLRTNSGYLVILEFSALAAACPLSIAVSLITLSPNVLTHVASQQRHLPWLKGKIVMPSGLFPSPRFSPLGSGYDGVSEDLRAWKIMIVFHLNSEIGIRNSDAP